MNQDISVIGITQCGNCNVFVDVRILALSLIKDSYPINPSKKGWKLNK